MDPLAITAYLVGAGGFLGSLVAIVRAKSEKRKINADAAQILVEAALKLNDPLVTQVAYLERKLHELQELLDTERQTSQNRIDTLEMENLLLKARLAE